MIVYMAKDEKLVVRYPYDTAMAVFKEGKWGDDLMNNELNEQWNETTLIVV